MNVGGEKWGVEQEVPFCFITELPLSRKWGSLLLVCWVTSISSVGRSWKINKKNKKKSISVSHIQQGCVVSVFNGWIYTSQTSYVETLDMGNEIGNSKQTPRERNG